MMYIKGTRTDFSFFSYVGHPDEIIISILNYKRIIKVMQEKEKVAQ